MKVLVTGAAGGIGAATAALFERGGHEVLRQDLRAAPGIDLAADLLDSDGLETVIRAAQERGVDTVVAAHGSAGPGALATVSDDYIARILRLNASSVFALYEGLTDVLTRADGAFIAVSSQAGIVGEAQNAVYCAAKFSLIGWAEGVASGPRSPRMRIVCPGLTETPLLVDGLRGMAAEQGLSYEEFLAIRLAGMPMSRLGRPAEIGRAILWLAELETRRNVIAAVTGGLVFD